MYACVICDLTALKKESFESRKKAAWTTWQCPTKGLQGTTLFLSSSWRTIIMEDLVFPFIWKAGRWFHPLVYPRPVIKPQEIEGEGNFQCCLQQKRLYIYMEELVSGKELDFNDGHFEHIFSRVYNKTSVHVSIFSQVF